MKCFDTYVTFAIMVIIGNIFLASASADIFELKSGLVIDGTMIEQTEDFIRIDNGLRIYKVEMINLVKQTADYIRKNPMTDILEIGDETIKHLTQLQTNHYTLDYQYTEDFRQEIVLMMFAEQYEGLENTANTIRSTKAKFESGDYKLNHFYLAIKRVAQGENWDGWQSYIRSLQRWGQEYPESITQHIALAEAYMELAWVHDQNMTDIRDGKELKFSPGSQKEEEEAEDSELTEEQKKQIKDQKNAVLLKAEEKAFKKTMERAYKVAEKAHNLSQKDVHLYSVMMEIGLGLGLPNDKLFEALKNGQRIWDDYPSLYRNLILPFTRQWYGQEGEAENMAKMVVTMFGKKKIVGEMMYAHIASEILTRFGEDVFRSYNFEWEHIQHGFEEIVTQNKYGFYYLNMYTRMACEYNDKLKARQLFLILADNWDGYSEEVWGDVETYIEKKNKAYTDEVLQEEDEFYFLEY